MISVLVAPFVPQNNELILLISKRESVILLMRCLHSYPFCNGDEEKASERFGERKVMTKHYLACVTSVVPLIAILCLICFTLLILLSFEVYYLYVSLIAPSLR